MKKFIILFSIIALLSACSNKENEETPMDPENKVTVEMFISGMTCAGCENTIVSSVTELDGTIEAEASSEKGTATIVFDQSKVDPEDFIVAIDKKGYTVESFVIKEPVLAH